MSSKFANKTSEKLSLSGEHHDLVFALVSDIHGVIRVDTDESRPTKLMRLVSFTANSGKMVSIWCELEYHTSVAISNVHHTLGVYSYAKGTRKLLITKRVRKSEVSIQYCTFPLVE